MVHCKTSLSAHSGQQCSDPKSDNRIVVNHHASDLRHFMECVFNHSVLLKKLFQKMEGVRDIRPL